MIACGVRGIDFVLQEFEDAIDNYVTFYDGAITVECASNHANEPLVFTRNDRFVVLCSKCTKAQCESKLKTISDTQSERLDSPYWNDVTITKYCIEL